MGYSADIDTPQQSSQVLRLASSFEEEQTWGSTLEFRVFSFRVLAEELATSCHVSLRISQEHLKYELKKRPNKKGSEIKEK